MSISSIDRPLLLRPRPELVIARGADDRWVASDPIRREHYELSGEERALLDWLRQGMSLRMLCRKFNEHYAPRRIESTELDSRLKRMHASGLLIAMGTGQGDALWRRSEENRAKRRRWAWTQLLALRLPGFDPDWLLARLNRVVGWAFSWLGVILLLSLATTAGALLMSHAREFAAELPGVASLAEPKFLAALLLSLAGLKTLHELGHGLACKRFGGEVREMGLLLLAGAPCLYCDVSDAWRLPSKRQRLLINAAGVLVELLAACCAVMVWRFSEPGLVHTLAINTIVLATLGTLLVNLNPLLRFDGYYLLSDLLGVANLWQRSREAVKERLALWFVRQKHNEQLTEPLGFAVYGIASMAYLATVMLGVAWLTLTTLRAWRLEAFGWFLVGVIAATFMAPPVVKAIGRASRPTHKGLRWMRTLLTAIVICLLSFVIWQAPSPWRIGAPAAVIPSHSSPIVVTMPGRLLWAIETGAQVAPGDLIATLHNPDVSRRLLQAEAEIERRKLELQLLEAQRNTYSDASALLPAAETALAQSQRRFAELQVDAERLTLRATTSGIVLEAPSPHETTPEETLPRWEGHPLDSSNQGAWLDIGDVVCLVTPYDQTAAELLVDEADAERVAPGLAVRLAFNQAPGQIFRGVVHEVAQKTELLEKRHATSLNDRRRVCRVRVEFTAQVDSTLDWPLLFGGQGYAKIEAGSATIGELLTTLLRRSLRLP